MIRNAGQTLTLISPYLKLSKDFRELLTYRNSKDKITTVIFGKQELKPDEMKFLQGLRFVILKYNEDLYAKCYVNDDKMIITSLNLYEFSMANNKEMGVLIDRNDPSDKQLFAVVYKEVEYITETSQRFDFGISKNIQTKPLDSNPTNNKSNTSKNTTNTSGYCIRTGVKIPFNPEKPLSYEAYQVWSQFSDPDYPEKFCHFTGESSKGETSVKRPILRKNWQKAKEAYRL